MAKGFLSNNNSLLLLLGVAGAAFYFKSQQNTVPDGVPEADPAPQVPTNTPPVKQAVTVPVKQPVAVPSKKTDANGWDMNYATTVKAPAGMGIVLSSAAVVNAVAKEIKESLTLSFTGLQVQKLYATLRKVPDKVRLSQIVRAFATLYGEGLYTFTLEGTKLNTTEKTTVLRIINPLPNYSTVKK